MLGCQVMAKRDPKKTLRNKCDKKLTPIVKRVCPNCESCGSKTEVAHHWIEKSRSSYLRYDTRNLIPLCHSCHSKIHNRFGNSVVGGLDVSDIIRKKRGEDWHQSMRKEANKIVKTDIQWYEKNLANLEKAEDEIRGGEGLSWLLGE